MPRGKKDDIDDEAMISIKQLLQIKPCDTLFILPHLISKRVAKKMHFDVKHIWAYIVPSLLLT